MRANFYLKQLIIQNFATFRNQTIAFRPGFNAIVGETGSGKSLVLDALQLILGGRADKKVVRRETPFSLIEASFHCEDQIIKQHLEQEGYPLEGNELVIKRVIYKNGTTKNYVNHLSCTVSFLASIARRHIDMVGQFENQKLLSENYQLLLLDQYGKLQEECRQYQDLLGRYRDMIKENEELEKSKNHRDQRLDYLNFQLQEIEKLNPSSQDEQELLKKKSLMLNLEKNRKLALQMSDLFEGNDGREGILNQFRALGSILRKNLDLFEAQIGPFSEVEDRLLLLREELEGKVGEEVDPSDLEGVLDRLDLYQRLKNKFGGSVESILQSQVDFLKEKGQLEELEINQGTITGNLQKCQRDLNERATALHEKRKKHALKLARELTQKVRSLKMDGATIKMEVERTEDFQESGFTRAFFHAETNKGEGYFKIKDTASGGELSRILLALRQILCSHDSISIFLFDEIDTGIGGETGTFIGQALKEVSESGQVIAITHLPQIAQYAEGLIVVQKETLGGKEERTESSVKEVFGRMIMKEVRAMAQLQA